MSSSIQIVSTKDSQRVPDQVPERVFENRESFIEFIQNQIGQAPFPNSLNKTDLSMMFTHGKEGLAKTANQKLDLVAVRTRDFLLKMSSGSFIQDAYLSYKPEGKGNQYYHVAVRRPTFTKGPEKDDPFVINFKGETAAARLRSAGFSPKKIGDLYCMDIHPFLVGGISFVYKGGR